MKIHACDVCLAKQTIVPAKAIRGLKSPTKGKITVELCEDCSNTVPKNTLSWEDYSNILDKALRGISKLMR